jgi:transposase IS200 family protein
MPSEASSPPLPEPLAYFLTWTAYGTWLPGDDRGWVKRHGRFEEPNRGLERHAEILRDEDPLILTSEQRRIVEGTIQRHCEVRGWQLWIVRARTNHVHVVVTANDVHPDTVMEQFKAWCTRKLKEADPATTRERWWTERGSTRYINHGDGLEQAILYVRDGQ